MDCKGQRQYKMKRAFYPPTSFSRSRLQKLLSFQDGYILWKRKANSEGRTKNPESEPILIPGSGLGPNQGNIYLARFQNCIDHSCVLLFFPLMNESYFSYSSQCMPVPPYVGCLGCRPLVSLALRSLIERSCS